VIAVVEEENDLTADLQLEPARGHDLRVEKSFREKPARLLAEADYRLFQHGRDGALRRPPTVWLRQ
jgi:hypothetical protein